MEKPRVIFSDNSDDELAVNHIGIEFEGYAHKESVKLFVVFVFGYVDQIRVFHSLRAVLPEHVPIIGGSCVGVITNDVITNVSKAQSCGISVLVLAGDDLNVDSSAHNLSDLHLCDTAENLASDLSSLDLSDGLNLLFFDSVKQSAVDGNPPLIHPSSQLLSPWSVNKDQQVPIFGAGLLRDNEFSPSVQYCMTYAQTGSAVFTHISGGYKSYSTILHGCSPLDGIDRCVTAAQGPVIPSAEKICYRRRLVSLLSLEQMCWKFTFIVCVKRSTAISINAFSTL